MKHRKIENRALILGFLLISFVLVFQINSAFAARSVLSVPQYSQQPYDNLCWATSTSMIISYFKGDTTDRTVEIAKDKYGTNFNQPGYTTDAEYYVKKYTSKAGSIQYNSLSYTAVQYQINHGGPIYTRIQWTSGGGHAMVIKGYDTSTNYVIYNDPWDGYGHGATYSYYVSNSSWYWTDSLFWE
ncbi:MULTISPECIES: papain-like cysteine protease family protein [Thermoanaerobacterium]|jgi:hypothetical protein|uniref:papain-like cysteine protease family protein n=1 Tax=Thermoanaerobacterium TaxID=28895 RepID=UPI00123B0EFA|nr:MULTISPECIES: papain-like cysteine protease family protein [Thermoanaerobacterium]KAA5806163.1 hypothetical protein F1655_10770 [Thermoanaerobacterium thermosaccharolyticum]MBE0068719.1 hypothetical protein [Thermoanaerobacterium thermosaccharolyticum]MBE0228307.1 hypothetical protein [Thermoanaerobacterium thermosaccharolyticum]MDE4543223.1 C39 family peptidase [Thermoanaerobacterium sp. R66]